MASQPVLWICASTEGAERFVDNDGKRMRLCLPRPPWFCSALEDAGLNEFVLAPSFLRRASSSRDERTVDTPFLHKLLGIVSVVPGREWQGHSSDIGIHGELMRNYYRFPTDGLTAQVLQRFRLDNPVQVWMAASRGKVLTGKVAAIHISIKQHFFLPVLPEHALDASEMWGHVGGNRDLNVEPSKLNILQMSPRPPPATAIFANPPAQEKKVLTLGLVASGAAKFSHWCGGRRMSLQSIAQEWSLGQDMPTMALSIPEPVAHLTMRGMCPEIFCLGRWFTHMWFLQQNEFQISADYPRMDWLTGCIPDAESHEKIQNPAIGVHQMRDCLDLLRRAAPAYLGALIDKETRDGEAMNFNVCCEWLGRCIDLFTASQGLAQDSEMDSLRRQVHMLFLRLRLRSGKEVAYILDKAKAVILPTLEVDPQSLISGLPSSSRSIEKMVFQVDAAFMLWRQTQLRTSIKSSQKWLR